MSPGGGGSFHGIATSIDPRAPGPIGQTAPSARGARGRGRGEASRGGLRLAIDVLTGENSEA